MADDVIGSLSVVISGDFSQLNDDLAQSQQIAAAGGEKIASAMNTAADSTSKLDDVMQAFVADGLEFDNTVKITTADLLQFGNSEGSALSSSQALDDAVKQLSSDMNQQGSAAKDASQSASGYASSIGSLLTTFAGFAGVTLSLQGLKAAVEEAFTAFAQLQRATESLTALTGSARTATDAIAQLRQLASDEALSFPSLLKADQQMAAFGISTKQSVALLAAAGDAAVATGRNFDSVSTTIERIVESGAAMGRTLQGVGLTTADLGSVMGVTAGEASKLFKSLDESTRVDIITAALGKFKDLAKDTSSDLTGSWQQLSNAAQAEFARVGQELAGTGQAFTTFAKGAIGALGSVADFFITFANGIGKTAGDVANALHNAAASWGVTFEDYGKAAQKAADSNKQFEQSIGTAIITARQMFAPFPEYVTQFNALLKDFQQGVIDGTNFTARLQVMQGQFNALHPTIGAAATATLSYTQEVAKLKKQEDDGVITHATYLQKLKELEIQHGATSKAVKDHVLSLADLSAKETQSLAEVQQALTVWSSARAIYEQTGQGVGLLNAAYDQMTAALKRAKEGFSDLSLTIISSSKEQAEAFKNFQLGFGEGAVAIIAHQKKLEDEANTAATTFNQLADAYKRTGDYGIELQTATDALAKALDAARLHASDLNVKLKLIGTDAIPIITGGTQKLVSTSGELDSVVKSVNQSLRDMGVTGGTTMQIIQGGVSKTVDLMDGFKSATDAASNGIQILKGGVLSANTAHQQLNTTAAQLPQILNADATTLQQVNSLIIQCGQATQQWATFMDEVADATKASADSFAAFEQAANDAMTGVFGRHGGGGTFTGGTLVTAGAGSNQAFGSAGAEGGGIINVGGFLGGSSFSGTPFGPLGSIFNPRSATPATSSSTSTPTTAAAPSVLDSGLVQAVNAQLQQMFSDMADAGQVDVAQLQALASTIDEFVTVDATGLHIAWQQATQAATTGATATTALNTSTTAAVSAVAGFAVDTAAAAVAVAPLQSTFAAFGAAVVDNTAAINAELQARTQIADALNQWIDQFNASNASSLTSAYTANPNQRFLSAAPLAHVLPPTPLLPGSGVQILSGGIPSASGSSNTFNIYNPQVRSQSDIDALVQQLRNLGVT